MLLYPNPPVLHSFVLMSTAMVILIKSVLMGIHFCKPKYTILLMQASLNDKDITFDKIRPLNGTLSRCSPVLCKARKRNQWRGLPCLTFLVWFAAYCATGPSHSYVSYFKINRALRYALKGCFINIIGFSSTSQSNIRSLDDLDYFKWTPNSPMTATSSDLHWDQIRTHFDKQNRTS